SKRTVRVPNRPLSITASVSWTVIPPASVIGCVSSLVPELARVSHPGTVSAAGGSRSEGRSSIEAPGNPLPGNHYRGPADGSSSALAPSSVLQRGGVTAVTPPRNSLSAEAESLDQRPVPLDVHLHHVVQQPAATADQQQEPATGVVVVLVRAQVVGQTGDALGQQRDLGLGGPGVRVVHAVLGQDLLLFFGGQRHLFLLLGYVPWGPHRTTRPGSRSRPPRTAAGPDCR